MITARILLAFMLVTTMIGLGGCSVARVTMMTVEAWSDVPVMPGARSVERKVDPFASPTLLPTIEFTLHTTRPPLETEAWFRNELTRRGWVFYERDHQEGTTKVDATRDRWWSHEQMQFSVYANENEDTTVFIRLFVDYMWAKTACNANMFVMEAAFGTRGPLLYPVALTFPLGLLY